MLVESNLGQSSHTSGAAFANLVRHARASEVNSKFVNKPGLMRSVDE